MLGQLRATFGFRAAAAAAARRRRLGRRSSASGPEPPTDARATPTSPATSAATSCWRSPAATLSTRGRAGAQLLRRPGRRGRRARAARRARPARAADLAAANTLRASLLQAVSHDLRTPLASIKASISSLRQRDIEWPPDDRARSSRRRSTRRPTASPHIVGNLLDMSRLQAGALHGRAATDGRRGGRARRRRQPRARRPRRRRRRPRVPARRRWPTPTSSSGRSPTSSATPCATRPPTAGARQRRRGARRRSAPRRRPRRSTTVRASRPPTASSCSSRSSALVDHQADGTGVGLGLAIARGFVEAMGGELTIEDTPGGGDHDGRRTARRRADRHARADALRRRVVRAVGRFRRPGCRSPIGRRARS